MDLESSLESSREVKAKLEASFDEASLQYIEEIGTLFEKSGVARVAGRILGLLLIARQPLNQAEIATTLQVSRASVSTNLQLLQAYNLTRITPRRKQADRRDYYEIAPGSWEKAFMNAEGKIKQVRDLARSGLKIVANDNKAAQRRLMEMEALYECYMEWWGTFTEAWEKRKTELRFDED